MTVRKADLEKQTQGREKRLEQDRNHFRIWAQEAGSGGSWWWVGGNAEVCPVVPRSNFMWPDRGLIRWLPNTGAVCYPPISGNDWDW